MSQKNTITFIILLTITAKIFAKVTITNNEKPKLNLFSLVNQVKKFGYPIEIHKDIETEDGYLLDVHRIPYGLNNTGGKKTPVFLMHGLGGGSECWFYMGPTKALPYLLADRGYDVWIGSARGTSHSRKHTKLDPESDPNYWEFSWHEIGYYDLPANFKYILGKTQTETLFYIGHSQGGTVFFTMATARPEMNKVVRLMVGLAPGVFYGFERNLLPQQEATFAFGIIENLRNTLDIHEVGPQLLQLVCNFPFYTKEICNLVMMTGAAMMEVAVPQGPTKEVQIFYPDSSSAMQALHYVQLFIMAKFQQYDHGADGNLKQYGTEVPPQYDIKKVTTPVALFYAKADFLVTLKNVKRLARELPNVVLDYVVPNELFGHLNFIAHKDVVELVYDHVFEVMEKYFN